MTEPTERTKYLGGRVPETIHRRLMATLKLQGKSWQEVLVRFVEAYVEKHWPKK